MDIYFERIFGEEAACYEKRLLIQLFESPFTGPRSIAPFLSTIAKVRGEQACLASSLQLPWQVRDAGNMDARCT